MKVAAFFDLDNTLIVGTNSLLLYVKHLVKRGEMSYLNVGKGILFSLLHKINLLNVEKLLDQFAAPYAGRSEKEILDSTLSWFNQEVIDYLSNTGKKQIEWHEQQGHTTAILSSAAQFVCQPAKDCLGIEHVLCTEALVENGILTGKFKKPLCYGEGKIKYAEEFAKQHDIDLSQSYFYTDSISDLPMLGKVGNAVAINPDPLLRSEAKKRDWEIKRWK